jgi:hypothetical protein
MALQARSCSHALLSYVSSSSIVHSKHRKLANKLYCDGQRGRKHNYLALLSNEIETVFWGISLDNKLAPNDHQKMIYPTRVTLDLVYIALSTSSPQKTSDLRYEYGGK